MAKVKYDGVVEAVRYKPGGEIEWVRLFERRGAAFTDFLIYDRKTLIERIKAGKRYVSGKRVLYLAGTFEVGAPLRLAKAGDKEILVTDEIQANQDRLEGVPVL
jgi:hypothetical protein